MASEIEKLKREFLEYMEIEKGSSLNTVENYDRYLFKIFEHGKFTKVSDIDDNSIREFRLWLNRQIASHAGTQRLTGKTISKKTQNYYMIALRMFLKYLARREIKSFPTERIDLAKVPERSLDLISQGELNRLLAAPQGNDLKTLRDRAILHLLFSTGLRVSELCSLTSDFDLSADEISVRGKGGKIRVVFISDEAKKAVKEYLAKRKDMSEALFVKIENKKKGQSLGISERTVLKNNEDKSLTRRSVERIVKQYAIKAGISKKVTPHIIRHCFATDLLQNGADIRSVQIMLGHSNIATTQIYTHITDKQLREVHKKFHSNK